MMWHRRNLLITLFVFTAIVLCPGWGGAALQASEKAPITFDALYSFETVSGVQLSPDGKWILFTTRKSIPEENKSISTIRMMDTGGNNGRAVFPKGKPAWSPRWIEGGKKIAYLAPAPGGSQVFTYRLPDGKTEQVTSCPTGVRQFTWSPTGEGVAFSAAVYPGDNSFDYYLKRKAQEKEKKHSGLLYEKLLFRPYSRWDDGVISHVFYKDFKNGKLTALTPGDFDAPASHLGGSGDIQISPDGKTVAFTMNTDPVKTLSTNNDVFLVGIDGKNRVRVSTGKGCDVSPRFSPDGNYLLYTQMARPGYEADQKDIIMVPLKEGKPAGPGTNLTGDFDRSVSQLDWAPGSKVIYFTCSDKGYTSFYRVRVPSGKREKILGDVYFSSVRVDAGGKYIYLLKSTPERPSEIFRYDTGKKSFLQLTHFSDAFVASHHMAKTEVFWYKGANDDPVMGFISFPPGYDPAKKYPAVFLFHGGPEGDWRGSYGNYGGNVHLFAANGYISVKLNIHGASSYGIKFQEAILGNWGSVDVEDVLKGLDYVLATYPAVDGGRVAGKGRSYGGYLVNMLNGKTDRFKCFVSVDGIFDQVMSYYTTDELWFMASEFLGSPLESPEVYRRSSPMTYAKNFKTPTLVLHGGRDYRVDLSQGIAMYQVLKVKGVPAQLLVFPDEPHYFRKAQTWKYAYEVQFKWLARWLKEAVKKEKY